MTTLLDEAGNKRHKVMVAVPCGGEMVHADFAYDLARMVGYTQMVRPDMGLLIYHVKGTYLPRARASLVNEAMEQNCTHILWLDSDMRFPKNALLHLLGHDKPVVAVNYPTRQHPILPTAIGLDKNPMFAGEGLQACYTCGMGVMLVDLDVFAKIGKPYFALGYSKAVDDYSGEDTYFCEMARRNGYEVLIDWPLTEQVGHCGGLTFHMEHARATLEAIVATGEK